MAENQAGPATETIGLDGKSGPSNTEKNLASIFDLAEQGKSVKQAVKEVMTAPPVDEAAKAAAEAQKAEEAKVKAEQAKKEEVKPKEEAKPKTEDKPSDDLRAQLDKIEEVKAAPTPEEKKEEKPEDLPDEELKVLETDKPKTRRRIETLLHKIDEIKNQESTTKKELAARDAKLKELEDQLKAQKPVSQELTDDVKKQLDELKVYRRKYELDNDPKLKETYDSRINSAEGTIVETLKRYNAGEGLLNLIKQEGGWAKFAASSVSVAMKNADGETVNVPATQAAEAILASLNVTDRNTVQAASVEQIATKRERQRYVEEETKHADEYFKNQQEQARKSQEQQQQHVETVRKSIDEWHKNLLAEDWLKDKPVPEGAAPEVAAAVKADNDYTAKLRTLAMKNIQAKEVPDLLAIVKESVAYYEQRRQNSRLQARISTLEGDLKKANEALEKHKNASRSTAKQGSIAPGSGAGVPSKTKTPGSLEEALAMREEGKLDDRGQPVDED